MAQTGVLKQFGEGGVHLMFLISFSAQGWGVAEGLFPGERRAERAPLKGHRAGTEIQG